MIQDLFSVKHDFTFTLQEHFINSIFIMYICQRIIKELVNELPVSYELVKKA